MNNFTDNVILNFNTQIPCQWDSVDDQIMGGSSQSQPDINKDTGLRFSGTVALDNNGGFASIRSKDSHYDLSQYSGLTLRLRGDGKSYKFSLRTDLFFDGVSYQITFTTQTDTWQEIYLPFADFIPTHHGIKLSTVAPMNISSIKSFGFFIADQQEGPFQIDVHWIKGTV